MAVEHQVIGYPAVAASVVGEGMAVTFASGAAAFSVHAPSGLTLRPIAGIADSTAATPGQSINIVTEGVTKAWAAGSIAAGHQVAVGSINGALVQFNSTAATFAASAANGPILPAARYGVGIALANAGAGDRFPVLVQPFTSL